MTLNEIVETLNIREYVPAANPQQEVSACHVTDVMSDALKSLEEGAVWVTIQSHRNVVAVASLRGAAAVLLSSGVVPRQETIDCAAASKVALLGTDCSTFEIAGRLYGLLRNAQERP